MPIITPNCFRVLRYFKVISLIFSIIPSASAQKASVPISITSDIIDIAPSLGPINASFSIFTLVSFKSDTRPPSMLSKVSIVRPSVSRGMIKSVMPFKSVLCPEVRAEKIKCEAPTKCLIKDLVPLTIK